MNARAIIVAAVALVGCGVSLVRAYAGLLLLVFLYFFRPDLWGAEAYVRPVKWLTLAVAAGWLMSGRGGRSLAGSGWLAVIAALYVASTLMAPFANESSHERLGQILKILVSALLIGKLCDTPRRLAGLVAVIMLGGAWFVKVAVLAWAASGFSGNVRIDTGVGQGGGANFIAWVLASTFPFVLYKALYGKGREKLLAAALIAPWLAGIIATGSRGGLLCLCAGGATFLVLVRRLRLLLAGGAVALLFLWLAPDQYTARIRTITLDPAKMDASSLARYQNFHAGIGIVRNYPLFGTGLGTFSTVKRGYVGKGYVGREYHVAHNTYVQMATEVGLPLLLTFVGMNVLLLWRLAPATKQGLGDDDRAHLEWVRIGVLSAMAATAVQMVKGDIAHLDFFWWLYAIAFRCRALCREAPAAETQADEATLPDPLEEPAIGLSEGL